MFKKSISYFSVIAIVIGVVFLVNGLILAWTPPISAPPADNVDAPLNVGSTGQSKAGGLILNTGGAETGLIVDQGNVGIGTAAPGAKLEVDGNVIADIPTADNHLTTKAYVDAQGGGGGAVFTKCQVKHQQLKVYPTCPFGWSPIHEYAMGGVTTRSDTGMAGYIVYSTDNDTWFYTPGIAAQATMACVICEKD